ncbi:MAG: helix-turn-helix domain-containing protein [Thermoflexales bacterium]|nr:helix-turn-helix domain-containing protein [Thermoflexales bacterium]
MTIPSDRQDQTRPGSLLFGQALAEWLQRAGKSNKEIAAEAGVDLSAVSHWLAGRRQPSPQHMVKILQTFYRWWRADWTVAEALNGIAPLGWSWEDIQQTLTDKFQKDAGDHSFREWWEKGKPQPLPEPDPQLPIPFVPRTEQNQLRQMVTQMASWRQARWKAILLTGVAGIGKTTLLAALTQDPAVRRHFHHAILWLDGSQKHLLEQAIYRVGLQTSPLTQREAWKRWVSHPHRRLLVVIDDTLPTEDLDALIAPAGPQVVFLLTTQKGPEVRAAIEHWLHREQVAEVLLRGMQEPEGFALIQQVQERSIGEREREIIRRVGHLLGWHPEALRIAARMAQDSSWADVLTFLEEEGLKGGEWEYLLRLLERQWERIGPERRERIERLVWRTQRGGPLEEPLAGAIWDTKPETARQVLRDLERTGLVERVAVHPAEWWRPQEVQMWRVTPVVFRVRREADPTGHRERDQRRWRKKAVFRRDWAAGYSAPPMPRSFALVATFAQILGILPKLVFGLGVALLALLAGRKDWNRRWEQWTTVLTPITNLRRHLERREIWMAEELELLIGRSNRTTELLLGVDAGMMPVLALAPLKPAVWWALMGIPCVVLVVIALFLAWFTWLSVLYGVRTWDLALMVRLTLALTWLLRWLGPVRRERERLLEAWNRGQGSA